MFSIKKMLATTTLLISVINAHAEQTATNNTGWYVGGTIGSSSTKLTFEGDSSDKSTQSFAVYGGYNFNEWLGVEGNFFTTGDVSNNRDGITNAHFGGLSLAPKVTWQLNPSIDFFAKAGLMSFVYTEQYESSQFYYINNNYTYSYKKETNGWGKVVGTLSLGAEFAVSDHIKLRLVYDHASGSLEDTKNHYDSLYDYHYKYSDLHATVNQVSFGAHYQF